LAVATLRLFGLKATSRIELPCFRRGPIGVPVSASRTCTACPPSAVTSQRLSGLNHFEGACGATGEGPFLKVETTPPCDATSHRRAVPSLLAVTTQRPLGSNAALRTLP